MRIQQHIIKRLFGAADVAIGGERSWDIQVRDDRFFSKVLFQGSLGLGESYMWRWWTTADLEGLVFRLLDHGLYCVSRSLPTQVVARLIASAANQQTRSKSMRVAERHYNLGNDLFLSFLGKYKNYSCGYFQDTDSLDKAQILKMDKICQELSLKKSDRLLDVGGGWGEFARYAATRYGCHVTSINISDEQIKYATEYCGNASVEIRKCDYRDLTGRYDKIAVIAMLTHVGQKNYRQFMEVIHGCLADGGVAIVETLGSHISNKNCEPWTDKYIFPGGMVPSLEQIDRAIRGLFYRERISDFGAYYIPTLRAWHRNLMDAWPTLYGRYSDTTRLMFEYFFLSVAGAFRAQDLLYWHIVLTKQPLRRC